jgi:hypothetical protein
MAAKKNSKKTRKSQRATVKKVSVAKRATKKKKSKATTAKRKSTSGSRKGRTTRRPQGRAARIYTHREGLTSEPETAGLRSGGQSGDLQGLRDVQDADSESVDELLEEGNAFEADVVAGVEHAGDDEVGEVHTHEVPEDDVPEEYDDKDL